MKKLKKGKSNDNDNENDNDNKNNNNINTSDDSNTKIDILETVKNIKNNKWSEKLRCFKCLIAILKRIFTLNCMKRLLLISSVLGSMGFLVLILFEIGLVSHPLFNNNNDPTSNSYQITDDDFDYCYVKLFGSNYTLIPTNYPSLSPTIGTNPPTPTPTHSPTRAPTPSPTLSPTPRPTLMPTLKPTNIPVVGPISPSPSVTASPTPAPVDSPTSSPSFEPTTEPTTAPSMPTIAPTIEFVDRVDIIYDRLISNSGFDKNYIDYELLENNTFNPGYRTVLESNVRIVLNSSQLVNVFSNYIDEVSVNSIWKIYNDSDDSEVELDEWVVSIIRYNEQRIDINESYGEYYIDSYFVIYSDVSINTLCSSSVCSHSKNDYFDFEQIYRFENLIQVIWNDANGAYYFASNNKSKILQANSPPTNGTCTITPTSTNNLQAEFDIVCNNWRLEKNGYNYSSELLYNFYSINQSLYLFSDYDTSSFINDTLISSIPGEYVIQAIIKDDATSLSTCYNMTVNINTDSAIDDLAAYNIFNISNYIFNKLDTFYNNGANTVDLSVIFLNMFEILEYWANSNVDVIDTNVTISNNLAAAQEMLILLFVEYTKTLEFFPCILSGITTPLLTCQSTSPQAGGDDINGTFGYTTNLTTQLVVHLVNVTLTEELTNVLDTPDTTGVIIETIANIIKFRPCTNEKERTGKDIGQIIVDLSTYIADLLLIDTIPGETFLFFVPTVLKAKISKLGIELDSDINDELCGFNNVILSNELLLQRSNNGNTFMNCLAMITYDDVYRVSNGSLINGEPYSHNMYTWQSNFLLLSIENENGINKRKANIDDATMRRNMLTYLNDSNSYLTKCEPIIISHNITNSTWFDEDYYPTNYPKCVYYNETLETYKTDGCYLLYHNQETNVAVCACSHTTYFSLSFEEFEPSINYVSETQYRDVTLENIYKHSIGWIMVIVWLSIAFILWTCVSSLQRLKLYLYQSKQQRAKKENSNCLINLFCWLFCTLCKCTACMLRCVALCITYCINKRR